MFQFLKILFFINHIYIFNRTYFSFILSKKNILILNTLFLLNKLIKVLIKYYKCIMYFFINLICKLWYSNISLYIVMYICYEYFF